MAHIVVMGGGLNGLTAGILLARDGHQVTVTERDPASPRGNAGDLWQRWDRRGVNQFRQVHFMLPRWRAEMERELPEVIAGLEALGGVRTSMLGALPDEMTGGKRDGDERFETVTGRRPVLEAAIAAVAKRTDGLTVCRGVAVTGLVTGAESIAGVPHVAGVTVGGATELHADLVIDATGRRSPAAGLLGAIGARRPDEEKQDCGFVYYARHFRSADGSCPEARERLLQHFEGVSILTLPCDTGPGRGLVTSPGQGARALRRSPGSALACSHVAHWGAAEPLTASGDRPAPGLSTATVVTGLVPVGDAYACTTPLGRGLIGLCTPAPRSARSARPRRRRFTSTRPGPAPGRSTGTAGRDQRRDHRPAVRPDPAGRGRAAASRLPAAAECPAAPGQAPVAGPRPPPTGASASAAAARAGRQPFGDGAAGRHPYRPSAAAAPSTAATCSRAAASSAAACCRSNASVAPSGSCSSSVPAALAASASPANSRSSAATRSRARARSASSTSCASTPRI